MRSTMRSVGLVAALLAVGLVAGTMSAAAATQDGMAGLGSFAFVRGDQPTTVPMLAPCDVNGTNSNSAQAVQKAGVAFGTGSTTCLRDTSAHTVRVEASGSRFDLTALTSAGGPRIQLTSYQVSCSANTEGTDTSFSYGGLSGISDLPQQVPANYQRQIRTSAGTLLATVVFNEVILPEPNDGSISVNLMHIRMEAASRIAGDVYVGSVACSPTS